MNPGTYEGPPPPRELIAKALARVYAEFDAAEVRLYLDCLEAEGPDFWRELPALREEAEARRAEGGATEPVPAPATAERPADAETPAPIRGRDPLTNLDHLVLDAMVASVAGGVDKDWTTR